MPNCSRSQRPRTRPCDRSCYARQRKKNVHWKGPHGAREALPPAAGTARQWRFIPTDIPRPRRTDGDRLWRDCAGFGPVRAAGVGCTQRPLRRLRRIFTGSIRPAGPEAVHAKDRHRGDARFLPQCRRVAGADADGGRRALQLLLGGPGNNADPGRAARLERRARRTEDAAAEGPGAERARAQPEAGQRQAAGGPRTACPAASSPTTPSPSTRSTRSKAKDFNILLDPQIPDERRRASTTGSSA